MTRIWRPAITLNSTKDCTNQIEITNTSKGSSKKRHTKNSEFVGVNKECNGHIVRFMEILRIF